MGRIISIGNQSFRDVIEKGYFYIDKTGFIKEWWESGDVVTLITRPRRFGKTMNMNMLESFFSVREAESKELFQGLAIWREEKYRKLQGTYPVISLSFANVKERNYEDTVYQICQLLMMEYEKYGFLLESNLLSDTEKQIYKKTMENLEEKDASLALYRLSDYISRYYGKNVLIFLDEYDTPMQEAYVNGFWDEMVWFVRKLFHSTFKTNPYLERAILTGITPLAVETPSSLGSKIPHQVSEVGFPTRFENTSPSSQCQASVFSDLNNLEVVTTTSENYETAFGFTEEEVFTAMEEYNLDTEEQRKVVKRWYDGFVFGKSRDIYNPWSIINFLNKKRVGTYWANTSSNNLIGLLLKQGDKEIKIQFEQLLGGGTISTELDEEMVFEQLKKKKSAIWSLLLASGYLKVNHMDEPQGIEGRRKNLYTLSITNLEVEIMFEDLVKEWFEEAGTDYNDFVKALLLDDKKSMNRYINNVALATFSCFDSGKKASESEPERFYHGFVLGLLVELREKYILTSNRESGFGRYDVVMEPRDKSDFSYIFEFKVQDLDNEKDLEETVKAALKQIEEKQYETQLLEHGISKEKIRKYGFAFCGKKVLIG